MGEPHIISGLKTKRARIAGEIIQAQEIVAQRTRELLAIDAVLRMFTPDSNPDMIAPIRPAPRGAFFRYGELSRLAINILRQVGKPVTLNAIVGLAMQGKGLADDPHLKRNVTNVARQALFRLERKGVLRRVLVEPDTWWELVGDMELPLRPDGGGRRDVG